MPFKKGEIPPGSTPFRKGQSGNPNGPRKKLVTLCKERGYSISDVTTTFQNMIGLTIDELKEVYENKDSTILEITIASALRQSIKKGSMYTIDSILDRLFGKAAEKINASVDVREIIVKEE